MNSSDVSIASDPIGYSDRDQDTNPGLNFRQTIWGWYDTKIIDGILYGKATRYEAQWELLDGNNLIIKKAEYTIASGINLNTSYYYPPTWGTYYVKIPTWDYVPLGILGGDVGGTIKTDYEVRGQSSWLRSTISIN